MAELTGPYEFQAVIDGVATAWRRHEDCRTLPECILGVLRTWPESVAVIEHPDSTSRYRWAEA